MFDDTAVTTERAEDTARLLRALGNPQRLLILCRLFKDGEAAAGDLAGRLRLSASALSQHLARMREQELIEQRREGRTLYYRIKRQLDARLPALLENICDEPGTEDASMNRMARTAAVVGLAFASTMAVAGNGPARTPTITAAGAYQPLPDAAYQPDPEATYKVVFSIHQGSDQPDKISRSFQRLARTVNVYTGSGVPVDHLKFVVVIYGPATPTVLDDTHYKKQFGVDNPNLSVIRQLHEHGIEVVVCGQALAGMHYQNDWVGKNVTVALSALTTITELEQKGYALAPL